MNFSEAAKQHPSFERNRKELFDRLEARRSVEQIGGSDWRSAASA
jgi:hypothetical protein